MPDTLSLSAGVSLGLLAGIVSGVCYLFVSWPKNEQERRRCLPAPADDGVCLRCGGDKRGGIVPCICIHNRPLKFESGAWFLRQAQRAASLMPWNISTDKLEQIDEECEGRESPGPSDGQSELKNVREFLETLSAKLAGGPLEGTRVAPLYHHPAYLPPRNGPSGASSGHTSGASGAHAQLKRLVARVVEEAAALPALARYAAEPPRSPTIESSTYEDLLATAILNKVIERYQTENGSGGQSSGIHSASASPTPSERSSPRSLNSRHIRDITPPLHEVDVSDWEDGEGADDTIELPKRVPFPEFGGDIVHHTDNEDRDFDEVSGSDIQAVDGSWEENWLFQKKKIKTIQSVPVPMLVPNSNTEYRVLIGDRDADDTTDLSDNASDAEEDPQYKSDIKRVLDSKHVIGGKTKVDDTMEFEPDSLTMLDEADDFEKVEEFEYKDGKVIDAINKQISDNNINIQEKISIGDKVENDNDSIMILDIQSGPLPKAEFNLKEEIHRSLLNGNARFDKIEQINGNTNEVSKDVVDSLSSNKGSINTLSRHEREGEYEETVTIPVQRYADSLRRQHFHIEHQEIPTRDTDKDDNLIPGSIAYRERQKWLNYVEMPNNPYSPEAIQKRLKAKNTSSYFDMLTNKTNDIDDIDSKKSKDVVDSKNIEKEEIPVKIDKQNISLSISSNDNIVNGRSKSPSPKILKDVLAEEIPQYKRYDRDYYIREAKHSAGARKKNSISDTSSLSSMNKSTSLDNFDTEFSPGLLIKQFNTIAKNQQYTTFAKDQPKESITITANNKTEILIEYDDANTQMLFSAKPIFVDDDTDKKFEEIIQDAYSTKRDDELLKSPTNVSVDNSYISTSSLEDSIKIYNVQTGEIVKCQPEDKISSRYDVVTDKNDNIEISDNNAGETADRLSDSSEADHESVSEENSRRDRLEKISEVEEILSQLPKVKELAKKFVSMDNLSEPIKLPHPIIKRQKSKDNILSEKTSNKLYMHSLTARSISKEFRDELKLSMATPLTVPGGSKEVPDGEEVTKESSRPGSPLPEPGSIKSKLAFFESLKSKFSNK